jgi:hypothetical protein
MVDLTELEARESNALDAWKRAQRGWLRAMTAPDWKVESEDAAAFSLRARMLGREWAEADNALEQARAAARRAELEAAMKPTPANDKVQSSRCTCSLMRVEGQWQSIPDTRCPNHGSHAVAR